VTDSTGPAEGPQPLPVVRSRAPRLPAVVEAPLDVAVGAAVVVARPAVAVTAAVATSVAPVVKSLWGLVSRPPLVPERFTAGYAVDRLGERGRAVRYAAGEDITVISDDTLDYVVPEVLARVLDRIDLTQLVLQRVDLERIVTEVLDRLDLTELVLERVDLGKVVNSAVEDVDLNTLIRTQVDVAGLAEEVIDEVDLPEIIRGSTSGVATVVVDGARMSAVSGDELVNRWVDKILLRRKARRTDAPGQPQSMRGSDD
jgi:hypothetical protein